MKAVLPPGVGALSYLRGDREDCTTNPPQCPPVLHPYSPHLYPLRQTHDHHRITTTNRARSNLSSFINVARRGTVMSIGLLLFRPSDMPRPANATANQIPKEIVHPAGVHSVKNASSSSKTNSSIFFRLTFHCTKYALVLKLFTLELTSDLIPP